ncbi:MAG TPA: MFS transporter [Thermoplasmata archaeon]|nr:MFS transporter [Thermoplasmata archaeon]
MSGSNGSTPAAFNSRYAYTVLLILAGMAIMVTYVETMVLPAFGNFEQFFGVYDSSTIAWILSAYLLVGVVVTPIFGKLGDLYGKKKILLIAMGIYAVAVTVAGFTPNIGQWAGLSRPNQIYVLIGVRAVQGIGMAMFPLGFAMLPEVFPANRVGQAQGLLSGMFATGAAAGLVGGGWIAQNYGWQLTYHTVIPFAVFMFIVAALLIRESKVRREQKIDLPGITSLGIGLTFLMLGITEGAYWGWTTLSATHLAGIPWGVPQFFVLAAIAFGFFLWWEPRAPSPVVSFKALRERNIWVSNVNGVLVGMTMFLLFTVLIIYGEYPAPGFGLKELPAALLFIPAVLGMMVGGYPLGRATGKFGPKPVMVLGFVLIAIGAFSLVAFHSTQLDIALIAIPIMVGNVAVLVAMTNTIILSVDPRTLGVQTGMNQTFRNLGSALGPVLVTSILASYAYTLLTPMGPFQNYHINGYLLVFGLVGAIGVVGATLSLAVKNFRFLADGSRHGHPSGAPAEPSAEPAPAVNASGRT